MKRGYNQRRMKAVLQEQISLISGTTLNIF